jgi:hypothetical protein
MDNELQRCLFYLTEVETMIAQTQQSHDLAAAEDLKKALESLRQTRELINHAQSNTTQAAD